MANAPVQPYGEQQICLVSCDTISGKNLVVSEKTPGVGIDSLHIYKMNYTSNQSELTGRLAYEEEWTYTDQEAIPARQSYEYKVSIVDTCGKESSLSAPHRTIMLQASSGTNHEVNLYWNPYEGFDYSAFEVLRKTGDHGCFILIGSVPGNTYAFTDLSPPSGINYYQIRIARDQTCDPEKSKYSYVFSNTVRSVSNGIRPGQVPEFNLYPNPALNLLNLDVGCQSGRSLFTITDQSGRTLISGSILQGTNTIDISRLKDGMYFFRFATGCKIFVKASATEYDRKK